MVMSGGAVAAAVTEAGGKAETRKLACKNKLTISRVPFSLDRAQSGVAVSVKLPDGTELTDVVAVDDVLVVAMGDSFASGESNPDRPVTFSGSREMLYTAITRAKQSLLLLIPEGLLEARWLRASVRNSGLVERLHG